jgi:SAM-dependent methyltransferase
LYGRRASQRERFVNAIEHFNPYGKHVVEIGSGTGDFLKFLLNRNVIVQSYSGLDILDDMTKRLSNRFADFSNISAETVDFLEWKGKRPDLIFAFSVFDRKIGSQMATERYAFDMLERMYEMSKDGVYCTFLASWKNIENIDEALFSPSAVLEFAHRISERVVLDCSFMPHAFGVVLHKKTSRWRRQYERDCK